MTAPEAPPRQRHWSAVNDRAISPTPNPSPACGGGGQRKSTTPYPSFLRRGAGRLPRSRIRERGPGGEGAPPADAHIAITTTIAQQPHAMLQPANTDLPDNFDDHDNHDDCRYDLPPLYPKQRQMVDDPARITCIEASTKAGKTTACLVWLYEQARRGRAQDQFWWVAPVKAQAKLVYRRLKRFIRQKHQFTASETELTITLAARGQRIVFLSGFQPDNLYGDDVQAAVIDEASRLKREAYVAVRSTLTRTQGRLKIIGNVQGRSNWFYQLCRQVEDCRLPNASYHRLTIDDAVVGGIISPDEVEAARLTLSHAEFRQLYYAEAFDNVNNPFAYAFERQRHVVPAATLRPDAAQPLYLSFDFNADPLVCIVAQHSPPGAEAPFLHILHEYHLPGSNLHELCTRIRTDWPGYTYYITGDASGAGRSHHSGATSYDILRKGLHLYRGQVRVPRANPPHYISRTHTNSLLTHHPSLKISAACRFLIEDLQFVEVDAEGRIDKHTNPQRTHLLDAFRYYLHAFHPQARLPPQPDD